MIISENIFNRLRILIIFVAISNVIVFAANNKSYMDIIEESTGPSREFLTNLIEKIDSPNDCFDLIKRRFLDGNFDDARGWRAARPT